MTYKARQQNKKEHLSINYTSVMGRGNTIFPPAQSRPTLCVIGGNGQNNAMRQEIEQLLPLIKAGKISEAEIQNIIEKLKKAIKEDPVKGKELGELFSRIKQASKFQSIPSVVNWVQVGRGFLAIGHKPGGKISYEGLKKEGTSAILTLLHENEGAPIIGKQVNKSYIEWIWFPFSASKPHQGVEVHQVYDLYVKLAGLLNEGKKVYIHCSAGIHRTGMITYGLLRFLGKEKNEAVQILQSLREVTAAQVGEDRLLWGEQFYIQQSS